MAPKLVDNCIGTKNDSEMVTPPLDGYAVVGPARRYPGFTQGRLAVMADPDGSPENMPSWSAPFVTVIVDMARPPAAGTTVPPGKVDPPLMLPHRPVSRVMSGVLVIFVVPPKNRCSGWMSGHAFSLYGPLSVPHVSCGLLVATALTAALSAVTLELHGMLPRYSCHACQLKSAFQMAQSATV